MTVRIGTRTPNTLTPTTMMVLRFFLAATVLFGTSQGFSPTPFLAKKSSLLATLASPSVEAGNTAIVNDLLQSIAESQASSLEWTEMFGLAAREQAFYALFEGIRKSITLGLRGKPFVLSQADVVMALSLSEPSPFGGYFTFDDLAKAIEEDFLDAGRGSTDNRKGWKMTTVSAPRGQSFEDARMTLEDVEAALEKGTVIFNSAGAHIPKLASLSLAAVDATILPNALNMYVTAPGKRTSAPPHTDKQDVVVVQTSGSKHWKIYSPPEPSLKPTADMFSRGKGDDNLPFFALETDLGCELLLETTLREGDVLFIPAAFPHTTDTADEGSTTTSIHLTFGLDSRVWDLDYLSLRQFALRRACVTKDVLGQPELSDNRYVGAVNQLPKEVRNDILQALPLGFLDERCDASVLDHVASEAQRISNAVDSSTSIDISLWKEATDRLQQHGRAILDTHRDMYLSAIEEGRNRDAEAEMTAHVESEGRRKILSPEQVQRLSIFRVKRHFDQIEEYITSLREWTVAGKSTVSIGGADTVPENWAFTLPIKIGDQVEADLGGAFFPAIVTNAIGNSFDVQFFDGDKEFGLSRDLIKLLVPPKADEEVDTSTMTPKQLKRWKKEQEKKGNK